MTTETAGFGAAGTFVPDSLFAGDFPRVTDKVTLAGGAVYPRGTVLGRVTATGKYVKCDPAANDGSQTPRSINVYDVDATGGDKQGSAYLTGEFNEAAISLGGAGTANDVRDGLRALSIFLKSIQGA